MKPFDEDAVKVVRVGDYVLIRAKVSDIDPDDLLFPVAVNLAFEARDNIWIAPSEIVGHELAPIMVGDKVTRNGDPRMLRYDVLAIVDDGEFLVVRLEGFWTPEVFSPAAFTRLVL